MGLPDRGVGLCIFVHYNYYHYYIIYMTICPDSPLIVDYVALCYIRFYISLFM